MTEKSSDKRELAAKILVVDDNPSNLLAVDAVLEPLGETIVLAHSGEEALQQLLVQDFAVVLLDVMMPGMTGFDVARMMRVRERTRAVPIIFLTARDPDRLDIAQGYSHRAVDYLSKPFDPDVLRAKVSAFAEMFRAREAARQLAREEERRAQAERERERFHALLMHAPVAVGVINGPEHVIELANERFCRLANRAVPAGKRLLDVFPELVGTPIVALLDSVFNKVEPFSATEFPVLFDRNQDGTLVQSYFDFNVEPLAGEDGSVRLMASALDVTDHVNARRVRDDFLSIASHELKTPLTTLRLQSDGMHQLIVKGRGSPNELAPRIDVMRRQIVRLDRLVNELLDVSRIAAGQLPVTLEDVDLAALAREIVDRFSNEAKTADCEVTVAAETAVRGHWDRSRLDQVLTNLLTNAMKYGRGHPIEVAVDETEGNARLIVRDEGIGIALEHQARVFERFERAVSDRSFGGLGLGLWIVSKIVKQLGEACASRVLPAPAQRSP